MAPWEEFTSKWIEPPHLPPSTKEYNPNINMYGTMMAMTPIGTLPTLKQKKQAIALTEEVNDPGKKTSRYKTRGSVERSSPAGGRARSARSTPVATIEEEIIPIDTREEDDEDYAPKKSVLQTLQRRALEPISTRNESVSASLPQPASPLPSVLSATPVTSTSASPEKQDSDEDRLEESVDAAVKRALFSGRYPTAYALRTLFDEFKSPHLTKITDLFRAVLQDTTTAEQMDEFQKLMKYKKCEGLRTDVYPNRARAQFTAEIAAIQESLAAAVALSPVTNSAPTFQEESSAMLTMPLLPSATSHPPTSPTPIIDEVSNNFLSTPLSPSRRALVERVSRFGAFGSTHGTHKETSYKSPFTPIPGKTVINGVSFGPEDLASTSGPSTRPITAFASQGIQAVSTDRHTRSVSTSSSLSSIDEDVLRDGMKETLNSSLGDDKIKRESVASHSPYPSSNMISSDPGYPKSYANKAAKLVPENNLVSTSSTNTSQTAINNKSRVPHWGVFNSAKATTPHLDTATLTTQTQSTSSLPKASINSSYTPDLSSLSVSQAAKASQVESNFQKLQPVYTDAMLEVKRKRSDIFDDDTPEVSFARKKARHVTPEVVRANQAPAEFLQPAAVTQPIAPKHTLRLKPPKTATMQKDDSALVSSPVVQSFPEHLALPSSPPSSRASTPRLDGRPSRSAKATGPRMKLSPIKNRTSATLRASPRAGLDRNSPLPKAGSPNQNQDFCSACDGLGDLVCCDGCDRSFHLVCVDPKEEPGELPDIWYCQACTAEREPPMEEGPDLWSKLVVLNHKTNPKAFLLPEDIREYFEGVATGKNGVYEEVAVAAVSKAKNRGGYDETPDWSRLKDSKGKHVICYGCHQGPIRDPTSGTNPQAGAKAATRSLISCSVCPHSWHIDCVDPPMTQAPHMKRGWTCPLHIDDLLAKVPAALGPAHRFRKIKNAKPIVPKNPKGIVNNGHIEVDLDPSDTEEAQTWRTFTYNVLLKIPEYQIKHDFIDKCRKTPHIPTTRVDFVGLGLGDRPVSEVQAALNLAHFAQSDTNDGIGNIIDLLLAEAPPAVVSMIALGNANELAKNTKNTSTSTKPVVSQTQRQSLQAMKALIDAQLAELAEDENKDATRDDIRDVYMQDDETL